MVFIFLIAYFESCIFACIQTSIHNKQQSSSCIIILWHFCQGQWSTHPGRCKWETVQNSDYILLMSCISVLCRSCNHRMDSQLSFSTRSTLYFYELKVNFFLNFFSIRQCLPLQTFSISSKESWVWVNIDTDYLLIAKIHMVKGNQFINCCYIDDEGRQRRWNTATSFRQ